MSRFSGSQHKGALREFKSKQREANAERDRKWREWDAARNAQAAQNAVDAQAWEAFIMGDTDVMPTSKTVERSKFGDVDLTTGDIHYMGGILVSGVDF